MGGKQKRAAKYKKWMEAQNLLKQRRESSLPPDASLEGSARYDGSGDGLPYSQPIPHQVQHEILKYRARKAKKFRNPHWILRKFGYFVSTFDKLPAWPIKILLVLSAVISTFVVLRSAIQSLLIPEAVDRAAMYNGLRHALPRPLYKFIRIVDYLFTSPRLSFEGIHIILYPPEEYYNHRRYT